MTAIRALFLTLTVACYTKFDIRTNVCWALCRQDGADTGSYNEKRNVCVCGFERNYQAYTDVVIKIASPLKRVGD